MTDNLDENSNSSNVVQIPDDARRARRLVLRHPAGPVLQVRIHRIARGHPLVPLAQRRAVRGRARGRPGGPPGARRGAPCLGERPGPGGGGPPGDGVAGRLR